MRRFATTAMLSMILWTGKCLSLAMWLLQLYSLVLLIGAAYHTSLILAIAAFVLFPITLIVGPWVLGFGAGRWELLLLVYGSFVVWYIYTTFGAIMLTGLLIADRTILQEQPHGDS